MEDKKYEELTTFIGDQFSKVYGEFDKVYGEFSDLKKDFHQLQQSVDDYATQANTYFMEMAAMGKKLTRHEKWIEKIAEKVGVKLDY